MTSPTLRRSPLTPSTVTPPSLNRQNSHNAKSDASPAGHATAALATLHTRSMSPCRSSISSAGSPRLNPLHSPSAESPQERRTSWEDCLHQREGYISFPDFDQLRAQREYYANRQ